jgi:hypothetical protein
MTARKSPAARKTSRSTRTKAELEAEIEELEQRLEGAPALSPQAETLAKEHVREVRQAVASKGLLSIEQIVTDGAQFGLKAQQTVEDITKQIAAKAADLKELKDAIAIEEAEIARLYDLDVAAASVQSLLQEHQETKAQLEKEQEAARASWSEEVFRHNKANQERDQALAQTRKREQDEYDYRTKQERQKADDAFAQNMLLQNRAQADRVAAVEKDLAQRQALIAAEEATIATLKERVANIDTEIASRVKQAEAIVRNQVTRDLTNEFALQKKDLELELRVVSEKNLSANSANEKLAEQVAILTKQLEAARQQVIEVSNNALASASGQVALNAVRETVKENGQAGGGRKS